MKSQRPLVRHETSIKSGFPENSYRRKAATSDVVKKRSGLLFYILSAFLLLAGPAFALPDWAIDIGDPGQDGLPAGSTLVYEVNISNASFDDPAGPTTITFSVDANTTMTSGGGLLGCVGLGVAGPTTVTCDVPAIPVDSVLPFLPEVLTTTAGTTTFSAVMPTAGDEVAGNNTAAQPTTVVSGSDIEVTVNGPTTAASGSENDYVFTMTNNGPDPSDGFDFTFPVPSGLDNIDAPAGCLLSGGSYVCSIPGIVAVGASVDLTFTGQISVGAGSTISPTGSVGNGSPADGVSSNNVVSIDTAVTAGSDVTIAKTIANSALLVGESTSFTLSPSYSGDSPTGLRITDTIPVEYDVTNIDTAGTAWDCSASAGNLLDCTLATGTVAGANIALGDITIAVDVIASGTPTNVATISAAGPIDPDPSNNTANDGGTDLQDPVVDHQANKNGPDPMLVAVGSTYDFTLSSSNIGNADFWGTLVIEDTIPAALTITSIDENGWTCTPGLPVTGVATIRCEIVYLEAAPLAAGTTSPEITTSALVNSTGPISNSILVSTVNPNLVDTNPGNNTITYDVTGQPGGSSTDIEITKVVTAATPNTVASGEIVSFTLEILNNGPLGGGGPISSLDVVVTDFLGELIDNLDGPNNGFVSAVIDPGTSTGMSCSSAAAGGLGRNLTCNIDVLPECSAGSCPTVTVSVRPGGNAGVRSNTADIISNTTADSDPNNNESTAGYTITSETDVTVTKTAAPSPASVGQDLVYIVTAENRPTNAAGDPIVLSTATNVVITDTLPDDMTFLSASPSSGSCTAPVAGTTTTGGNNQVVCSLGSINNNGQQTVTITVRPNNETLSNAGPEVVNNVAIATDTDESDAGNNTASVTTPILLPAFDLIVNKSDNIDPVAVNQDMIYEVAITNFGPSAAENIVVTDIMPTTSIAYQSASSSTPGVVCTPSGGTPPLNIATGLLGVTLECTIPYIADGDTVIIEIVATGDSKGTVNNFADVEADGSSIYDTDPDNDEIVHQTTVRTRVDVRVNSKTTNDPSYNVGEDFDWIINIENVDDASELYGVADDVVLTDTLPANMILTSAPTWPGGTCTVSPNNRTFSCAFGTMAVGELIDITVPSRVTAVTSEPQTFTNSATIETSSRDADTTNNTETGNVDINSSSISGTIFRDFNNDGTQDADDTNVNVVQLTLTGTDLNGDPITPITITTTDGTYNFEFLPQGNYVVTRAVISETFQTDGQNTAGAGGPLYTGLASPAIALGGNSDEPGYNFAIVPQARIGLAKQAGTPVLNADGSFDVQFDFAIENFSLEELNSVNLDDQLSGAADLFGTYTALTSSMARGSYTVLTAPTSSCGGAVGAFTGDGGTISLMTGGTIAAGATCSVVVTLRVMPTDPLPTGTPRYLNSATAEGVGTLSGQTKAGNPLLEDTSDNGANPDQTGNGAANDGPESDPTPVDPNLATTVQLEKTVSGAYADPAAPVPGEILTYTYTVTNPTNYNILDIEVTDVSPGFTGTGTAPVITAPPVGGSNIGGDPALIDLAPASGVVTFTATYAITQADIDTGFVQNTATVDATDVYGGAITDNSDDPTVVNGIDDDGDGEPDDPTIETLPRVVELGVAKTIVGESLSDPFLLAGDTIDYQFVVTNTGNTNITAVVPVDPGPAFNGVPGTGAAMVFATSDAVDLGPGDDATFTATYTLTATDVDNFYTAASPSNAIVNIASATGTPPVGTTIDPDPDTTETGITPVPSIVLTKEITAVNDANGNGILGDAGDEIVYDLIVENNGNTSLANIGVNDAVLGLANAPLTAPSAGANLAPGETGAIEGLSYTITPLNLAQGNVVNTADVSGTPVATNTNGTPNAGAPLVDGAGAPLVAVTDTSDTLTDPEPGAPGEVRPTVDPAADGDSTATVVNLPVVAADITITKRVDGVADTNANGVIGDAQDIITYTLVITNTGTTALADILVEDAILGLSQNIGGLAIGADFSISGLEYSISIQNQADQEVVNTATAAGDPVATGAGNVPDAGNPLVDDTNTDLADVTDDSDTLTEPDLDASGNVEDVVDPDAGGNFDDPTIVNLPSTGPAITITKAIAQVNDLNNNGFFGDAGDEVLYDFIVTNTGNASLAGVTISDAKLGMVNVAVTPPNLAPGDVGVLNGQSYIILAQDQADGEVVNTATTSGQPVVTDPITGEPDPSMPLTDDTGADLDPIEDTSDTRTDPDLNPDGSVVTTADPDADGDDDAPTILNLTAINPDITLVKSIVAVNDANGTGIFGDAGDTVEYLLTVENTGNTSLGNILINDAMLGLVDVAPVPDNLAPGSTATLTPASLYTITPQDQGLGQISNTAQAAGTPVETGPGNIPIPANVLVDGTGADLDPVEDTSDTRTDPDLNPDGSVVTTADPDADGDDNAPTLLNLPTLAPGLTLTKAIAEVRDVNMNGLFGDVGDEVVYEFAVTNTGNTSLANVTITDAKLGLVDVAVVAPNLAPGDVAVLLGQVYEITPIDQAAGDVENTATASGVPVATNAAGDPDPALPLVDDTGANLDPVDDTSDTLTDPDLNPDGSVVTTADPDADGDDNAPTLLNLPAVVAEITLVKAVTEITDTNNDLVLGGPGDTINYEFVVTNTGETSLGNVTVTDVLLGIVDAPTTPSELAPGDSSVLLGSLLITPELFLQGFVENTAATTGTPVATNPDGTPNVGTPLVDGTGTPLSVTDISDTGSEPTPQPDGTIIPVGDPAGEGTPDDPTVINIPLVPSPLSISGTVFLDNNRDDVLDALDDPNAGAGYTVQLIDAGGNVIATTVAAPDGTYEMTGFPAGTYTVNFVSPSGGAAGTLGPYTLDLANQTVTGVDLPLVGPPPPGTLTLVKTANVEMVMIGDTVTYEITATNMAGFPFMTATIADTLPAGTAYTPGTTLINGASVVPDISGQTISVSGLTVPAGGTVTMSLQARVLSSAPSGGIVNRANLVDDLTGDLLSQTATATVRRQAEAVFDCSNIIGKVFDDVDRDGYQDGLADERAAITDQDIFSDGKFGVGPSAVEPPTGEPGLPGVRLATTDGTIITTDEHGRYSVPCAALPGAIGENFTLKLDTNSLPTGYRVTTENPRTMRVTAGIMTEMNFGASIGRVVDIDLTGSAFDSDHEPTHELFNGLDGLLAQIAVTPSILRISYFTNGEGGAVANRRLDALEDVIRDKWRRIGNYRLVIERSVLRLQ